MTTDVTDQTFEAAVRTVRGAPGRRRPVGPGAGPAAPSGRSSNKWSTTPTGPSRPAKVNVDDNPAVSAAFQVQSIPAVFARRDRQVVDGFIGAVPEQAVREFVGRLVDQPSEVDLLVGAGDEASLRKALEPPARPPRGHRPCRSGRCRRRE